eukprot:g29572.t1
MRLREFFQDVSSEPNDTTNGPDQLTERSMGDPAKKKSNWTPPECHCPGVDGYAQAIRESVNARFISRTDKVVQNVTQIQRNDIHAVKTNCNIVIKPADKGGANVIQNKMYYCKEVYRQLNNQEHYRQLPAHTILQHIHFIHNHNVFTYDNWLFIQTHGITMGTRFASQYTNIFMHKFEQNFFAAQDLQPMLYIRYIDDIIFLWTHGEESLKQLHSDISKFHSTIRLTMDYSSESVSFLDTCICTKDRHLSTPLYRKSTDNFTMLHFSGFHPKHFKIAIPYRQALRTHRICSDEEECDGHLKMLKDTLIGTGYDAQLIDRQFR